MSVNGVAPVASAIDRANEIRNPFTHRFGCRGSLGGYSREFLGSGRGRLAPGSSTIISRGHGTYTATDQVEHDDFCRGRIFRRWNCRRHSYAEPELAGAALCAPALFTLRHR